MDRRKSDQSHCRNIKVASISEERSRKQKGFAFDYDARKQQQVTVFEEKEFHAKCSFSQKQIFFR